MKRLFDSLTGPVNKKPRFESNDVDYAKALVSLGTLSDRISNFFSNYDKEKSSVTNILQTARDKIPQLVVWGPQSGGKSSFLSILSGGEIKHTICEGVGTQCPIEIRKGPQYENRVYMEEISTGKKIFVSDTQEAEKAIKQTVGEGKLHVNAKIVKEIKDMTNSMIITDLPGCVDDKTKEQYFIELKNNHLSKPETVIVHVTRGDVDPAGDISAKYLFDIKNKVIHVLTHTDIWETHHEKIHYLHEYIKKYPNDTIALVNNKPNEIDILNKFKFDEHIEKKLIRGTQHLSKLLVNELQNKVREILPSLRESCDNVKQELDEYLDNTIGRTNPDMKELIVQFRTEMRKKIEHEFNANGTILSKLLNKTRGQISIDKIRESTNLIPQVVKLTQELREGNRRQIDIPEKDIMNKYIAIMLQDIKDRLLNSFVKMYAKNLFAVTNKILEEPYRPATEEIQKTMLIVLENKLTQLKEMISQKIIKYLDMIKHEPVIHDKSFMEEYHYDTCKTVLDALIKMIDDGTSYHSIKNNRELATKELASRMPSDPFIMKGHHVNLLLNNFWKTKSIQIYDNIVEYMSDFDNEYSNTFINCLEEIDFTDLKESEKVQKQREELLGIINICEEIIG